MSNPCIRCGKERLDGNSWKEKVGISIITHVQTICPDSECQKIVDRGIAERIAKSELLLRNKAKAKLEREKLSAIS